MVMGGDYSSVNVYGKTAASTRSADLSRYRNRHGRRSRPLLWGIAWKRSEKPAKLRSVSAFSGAQLKCNGICARFLVTRLPVPARRSVCLCVRAFLLQWTMEVGRMSAGIGANSSFPSRMRGGGQRRGGVGAAALLAPVEARCFSLALVRPNWRRARCGAARRGSARCTSARTTESAYRVSLPRRGQFPRQRALRMARPPHHPMGVCPGEAESDRSPAAGRECETSRVGRAGHVAEGEWRRTGRKTVGARGGGLDPSGCVEVVGLMARSVRWRARERERLSFARSRNSGEQSAQNGTGRAGTAREQQQRSRQI